MVGALLLVVVAWLAGRHRGPPAQRALRAGVAIFLLPTLMMLAGGFYMMFGPPAQEGARAGAERPVAATPATAGKQPRAAAPSPVEDAGAKARAAQRAEVAKRLAERKAQAAEETRIMSGGTYAEAVRFRAGAYLRDLGQSVGLSVIALGLFLLGG